MKSRLMAFGRIQKGRPERCLMVVLDERFPEALPGGMGLFERYRRVFRFFTSAVKR
jgi:hypothetical protein